MANALSSLASSATPPAPNPDGGAQSPANALAMPMGGQGLAGSAQGQPGPQQPPAPNHQQTVAALRHFMAIEQELTALLKDPSLGKSDMKSKIIDGTTQLVADGILTAPSAIQQLATVPERPFEQKQWLMKHFSDTISSQNAVLDHHRMAFGGVDLGPQQSDPDDHQSDMDGLMSQYRGANG